MKRRHQVVHMDAVPQGVLLYTKTQMAALLQVSLTCLNQLMRSGQISYLKIGGKLVRFRASHVLRRLRETSFVCHAAVDGHELRVDGADGPRKPAGAAWMNTDGQGQTRTART